MSSFPCNFLGKIGLIIGWCPLGLAHPLWEILDPTLEVAKINFLLLPLDRYLFNVVSGDRYLSRGSKQNELSITITGNVTVHR